MRDAAIDIDRPPRRSGTGRPASDRTRGDLSSAAIAAQRLGGAVERPTGRIRETSRRTAPRRRWSLPSFAARVSPIKALSTVVFSAALVGIVANAVLFQKGRHAGLPFDVLHGAAASAPTTAAKDGPAADRGATGAVSAPADPAPAAAPPETDAASSSPVTPAAPAAPHRSASRHATAKPGSADAIGQLLGGPAAGEKDETKPAGAKPAEAKPDPALLRAQRQLQKLGYAVKPDGRMDGGTRQAFKRFAHDHHLKAEAALTPELKRQIADASAAPPKPAAEPAPKGQ